MASGLPRIPNSRREPRPRRMWFNPLGHGGRRLETTVTEVLALHQLRFKNLHEPAG